MSGDPAVKARKVHLERAAERALDDPVKRERAVRIVRAGIQRGVLTESDLRGPVVRDVIDSAPSLSGEQVDRLRGLLPQTGEIGGGANAVA